ncbi:calcium-binding protein [Scytonema sp. PRP1]|uniref:calcium-binding protein n=1 Tax=Scytonema sp. PRP1 TaxID=3120513 RepID=UPI002FD6A6D5
MSLINGTVQNDAFVGTYDADTIFGSDGNDSINGLGGNDLVDGGNDQDKLQGGDGNDRLYASNDQDNLTGGEGDDVFVIGTNTGTSTLASADLITDFGRGNDLIELTKGLTFEDLNIFQGTGASASDTIITNKLTSQVLAVLQGVNSSTIDNSDFISVPGKAVSYGFTKIADTSGPFKSFTNYPRPAINNTGTVAFAAELDAGGNGIFIGNGKATTTIADTNGPFSFVYSDFSFNNQGTVTFAANVDAGGIGIFVGNGEATSTIADTSGSFSSVFSPSINDKGTVAFQALLDTSGESVFTGNGGALTPIVGTSDNFVRFSSSDINAEGTVVYRTLQPSNGTVSLSTYSNGVITTVVDNSGSFSSFGDLYLDNPSLNDAGTVAFGANLDGGGSGIFTKNDGVITTIADTTGSFARFNFNPSINNSGDVAFLASLDADIRGEGIFTGSDPIADKVIATGDSLFGSTVTNLEFFGEELNDVGQIAFYASLANGTTGIFVANQVM